MLTAVLMNALLSLLAFFEQLWRLVVRPKAVEWVVYELHGHIVRGDSDARPNWSWRLPAGPRISDVAQLRRELDFLKTTPVRGIVLRLREPRCGAAVLRELRAAFQEYRDSGHEVVVHADQLDNRGYWLASVANRIWLAPRGRLELIGFAASSSAAARPLRKLGVTFDIIRAGVFKSAGELMGADKVSDAQKHQVDELIGDLNDVFLSDVSQGRGKTPAEIQALIDSGPYGAPTALTAGLIDGLAYADEMRTKLGHENQRARVGPFKAALAATVPPSFLRPLRDRRPQIAIVDVEGVIASGKSRSTPWLPTTAGSDSLVAALTRLRLMTEVKAVVLRIDSRGGSAAASDLIWRAAVRLNEEKPVVAYLDDVAASGGYYIAAAARRILAAPTCITGSIGVFMMRPDFSGTLEKLEIDRATIQRGARAAIYRPDHALTGDERASLQTQVRETYDDFIHVVTEGRKLPEERVRELAEGRVYLATRAKELGLVDATGTLTDAVAEAARIAELKARPRLLRWEATPTGWRGWLRLVRSGGDPEGPSDRVQMLWIGESPV